MNITEFLHRRLNEDEEYARNTPKGWTWTSHPRHGYVHRGENQPCIPVEHTGLSRHIARHDPARVLAEVASKRAILEAHDQSGLRWAGFPRADRQVSYCLHDQQEAPCLTLLHVAAVYAGHRDYNQEWAP